MENHIVKKTEAFVKALFEEKLSDEFIFHDLAHTLSVRDNAQFLAKRMSLDSTQEEILTIAALLHDTGYVEVYKGHEEASKNIATEFLQQNNYPEDKIKLVLRLIDVTQWDAEPETLLEKVIKDADLVNLGGDSFFELGDKLRKEWEVFCNEHYTNEEWQKNNKQFLKDHQYYTEEAKELFGPGKKQNLKKMKNLMKKEKSKGKGKGKDNDKMVKIQSTIGNSKSAQMMFKTSLRNHIDLTNIADNKANIMLSINTLIITLAMPLLAGYYQENQYLLLPSTCLLLTCTLTIIFATMATRPIKMMGNINPEKIKEGNSNVFFFGNFFKMSTGQYHDAVQQVITDEPLLEKTIVNDLYYLGKALGEKYSMLRKCYFIFMVGITTTVIAFAISFARAM